MATSFEDTPKWFNADFYLESKLTNLIVEDPKGNWSRPSLLEAFKAAGFDNPYDHYVDFGDKEGLSPNPLFNSTEYLAAKTAQLGSTWTPEMVAKAIADAGMTLMQHYEKFGSAEGLSPSSDFNQDKYYDAKLDQLKTTEPDKGWTLDTLKAAFAAAGLTPLDHYLEYAKAEKLDKFDYSDNGDPIPHPGNKIALTKGADTATPDATVEGFKTSGRDDVISGVVSSLTSRGTFTAGDVIDGGDGVDTLTLDMQGDFNFKSGSVKNVENIVLNNAATHTFDAKGVGAATLYTVNGGDKTSTVTIKNVDSTETGYSLKQEAGTFKVQVVDSALTGKEDNVTIALNGVGTDTASAKRVTLDVGGTSTAGKVEGLTLLAEGKDSFVTLAQKHATATVMGAGNVDVTVADKMVTFDASAATGKVSANLAASLGTLKTIKGGVTDDTFTVGALSNSAVVNGGDGIDTLKFGPLTSGDSIKSAITGVETFEVTTDATPATVTFDLSKVEGLETIKIGGATDVAASGDFMVTKATTYGAMNLQIANELKSVDSFSYDGSGVLNVSLVGDKDGASSGNTTLTSLVAKNITDLTLTNNAEEGDLIIADVDAVNVTSLTLNGESGISFTYDSTAAAPSKLKEVNASDFTGELTLDLSNATVAEGVTVTMGGGDATKLTGTAKADTFILNDIGAEKVVLAAGTDGVADRIVNFGSEDELNIGLAGTGTYTDVVKGVTDFAANKVFHYNTAIESLAATTVTAEFLTDLFGATAVASPARLVLTDGSSVGVYTITGTASKIGSVQLMGILESTDIGDLAGANFVDA